MLEIFLQKYVNREINFIGNLKCIFWGSNPWVGEGPEPILESLDDVCTNAQN